MLQFTIKRVKKLSLFISWILAFSYTICAVVVGIMTFLSIHKMSLSAVLGTSLAYRISCGTCIANMHRRSGFFTFPRCLL